METNRILMPLLAEAVTRVAESGFHPSSTELVQYVQSELNVTDADRVESHIVLCSECLREVEELRSFYASEESIPPQPEADIATAWNRFTDEVMSPARRENQPHGVVSDLPRQSSSPWRLVLAAALLLFATGLGTWLLTREGSTAMPNVVVYSAIPDGLRESHQTRGANRSTIELASEASGLLLVLNVTDFSDFPSYVATLRLAETGAVVWQTDQLLRAPDANFTVFLPSSLVTGDDYRLELSARTDTDEQVALGTYSFSIVKPAA